MLSASPRAFLPIIAAALCLPAHAQQPPQPRPVPLPITPPQPKPATPKPIPSLDPSTQTAHLPSSLDPNEQKALDYLLKHVTIDDTAILPGTGSPLTSRGTWSVSKDRPASCPKDSTHCVLIIYRTPDASVSPEWVVLLSPDGTTASILDQNVDATRYMLRTIPTDEAAPYVISRHPNVRQPLRAPGTVEVGVTVDATGAVTQVMTISGPEALRTIAYDMAGQWTFRPLTVGSQNIPYQTIIKFHFNGPELTTEP